MLRTKDASDNKVYMLDFGMVVERPTAEPIDDAVDNGLWFAGTVDYASTRALQELRLGCGDDIESLGNAWPPCIAEEACRGKQTLSPCSLVPILLPITNECWLYCARRLHALGSLAQEASVVWQRRLLHSGCRLQTAAEKSAPAPLQVHGRVPHLRLLLLGGAGRQRAVLRHRAGMPRRAQQPH